MAEKVKMPEATAIFHITEIKKAFEKDHLDTEAEALQMGIDALQQPKWIPCSERMPEEEKDYLIAHKWADHVYYSVEEYASDLYEVEEFDFADKKGIPGFYHFDDELGYSQVEAVAWMEIEPWGE